jgi:nicotinamidase-related amidase
LIRSQKLLDRGRSHLLVIDMQQKLLPVIRRADEITSTAVFLLNAATVLQVPISVSEQYPEKLGPTVPEITQQATGARTFDKIHFSAAEGFRQLWHHAVSGSDASPRRDQVVIVGIETHVCVLQTAFDLLANGDCVYVVEDGVGSRDDGDRANALQRISDAGGVPVSGESVVFEWCEVAGTDAFREISRLTRERHSLRSR